MTDGSRSGAFDVTFPNDTEASALLSRASFLSLLPSGGAVLSCDGCQSSFKGPPVCKMNLCSCFMWVLLPLVISNRVVVNLQRHHQPPRVCLVFFKGLQIIRFKHQAQTPFLSRGRTFAAGPLHTVTEPCCPLEATPTADVTVWLCPSSDYACLKGHNLRSLTSLHCAKYSPKSPEVQAHSKCDLKMHTPF